MFEMDGDRSLDRLISAIQRGEAALFVGAGMSVDSGAPTGPQMADALSAEFLGGANGHGLSRAAALAEAMVGRKALNEWIERRLGDLSPSETMLVIPTIEWRAIYTVNFDTLVEQAYVAVADRRQSLRAIYSDRDRLELRQGEVALYKLHGCITRANTAEGHLTLTPEDVLLDRKIRKRLVGRLIDSMSDLTVFYAGFGREDPDFTEVLLAVKDAAGDLRELRRSFALQPTFTEAEERLWEHSRVTLIGMSAADFFARVASEPPITTERRPTTAYEVSIRRPNIPSEILDDIGQNFEIVDEKVGERPDPSGFFHGSPPTWGTVAARVDAARDLGDEVVEAVLIDPLLDAGAPKLLVVHAEAGAGKTTLLRRLAVDLVQDWNRLVIALRPYGALDFLAIERLESKAGERIYVVVDNAPRVARELSDLLSASQRAGVRVTILAAARTNEWREIQQTFPLNADFEFELQRLSIDEIGRVLDSLQENGELGLLAGQSREAQISAFESRAQKQLLVALREATEGRSFDDIIVDEFDGIPSADGQRAYLLVASLHRFGMLTRAGLLNRVLNIPIVQLPTRVFEPTEKIILSHEQREDIYYSTRHPLIAQILVDRKLGNERRRLEYYEELLSYLDIGYASDADTYRQLTRRLNRDFMREFESPESRRIITAELLEIDPLDPFAHQHAAMMEMDLGNLDAANRHLQQAIEIHPLDPSIRDTEGLLMRRMAEDATDLVTVDSRYERAENIFQRNITRRRDAPYGYKNLAETYLSWSRRVDSPERRAEYLGLAYSTVQSGLENCPDADMLLQFQGVLEEAAGEIDRARAAFAAALKRNSASLGTRFMAAKLEERAGDSARALEILEEGLEVSGDSHELHHRIATLMANSAPDRAMEIRGHFDAALLGRSRDFRPRIGYAAYLFGQGEFDRAREYFSRLDEMVAPSGERFRRRVFNFPGLGGRHTGRIIRVAATYALIEFRQGAATVYWRWRDSGSPSPREGGSVEYALAFTFKGPVAVDVAGRG